MHVDAAATLNLVRENLYKTPVGSEYLIDAAHHFHCKILAIAMREHTLDRFLKSQKLQEPLNLLRNNWESVEEIAHLRIFSADLYAQTLPNFYDPSSVRALLPKGSIRAEYADSFDMLGATNLGKLCRPATEPMFRKPLLSETRLRGIL